MPPPSHIPMDPVAFLLQHRHWSPSKTPAERSGKSLATEKNTHETNNYIISYPVPLTQIRTKKRHQGIAFKFA